MPLETFKKPPLRSDGFGFLLFYFAHTNKHTTTNLQPEDLALLLIQIKLVGLNVWSQVLLQQEFGDLTWQNCVTKQYKVILGHFFQCQELELLTTNSNSIQILSYYKIEKFKWLTKVTWQLMDDTITTLWISFTEKTLKALGPER